MFLGRSVSCQQRERRKETQHKESGPPKPSENSSGGGGLGRSQDKGTYLRSKYFSLKSRLGPKKAIMAIAHRILKALYYIIKHGDSFRDLGEDYLIELRSQSITSYLERQAKKLGMVLISESLWNQMIHRSPA